MTCYPEMHDRIVAGVACEQVGQWIQEEKGEYLDVKLDSLVRVLYRYKEEIPAGELKLEPGTYLTRKLETLKAGVNELDALKDLYLLQMSRISLAMEKEEKLGFPNTKLWRDVVVAREILETSVKLKMELGLMKRAALDVNVSGTLEHEHKAFLDKMNSDQRRKLGAVTGTLVDAIKDMVAASATVVTDAPAPDDIQEADYEIVPEVAAPKQNDGSSAAATDPLP